MKANWISAKLQKSSNQIVSFAPARLSPSCIKFNPPLSMTSAGFSHSRAVFGVTNRSNLSAGTCPAHRRASPPHAR